MNTYMAVSTQESKQSKLTNPLLRVISMWIWWFVGAAATAVAIIFLTGNSLSNYSAILSEHRHLVVYIEIVSVGLLPILYTIICKDDLRRYGLQRQSWRKGLVLSLLYVLFMYGVGYLVTGQIMSDSRPAITVAVPWSIFYGLLSIFAWGPLEVFFVVWLIDNTDAIFGSRDKVFSWGLVITVVIFGLTHILTTDLFNATYTSFVFLILGLIFKTTRSSYGPMLAWTLINGQVWFMAHLLFV